MVDVPGDSGVGRGVGVGGEDEGVSESEAEVMVECCDYSVLQSVGVGKEAFDEGVVVGGDETGNFDSGWVEGIG